MISENSSRNPQVMKIKEVAEYLKVHRSTIYRLIQRKAIPAFKTGNDWRFNIEEIDAWRLGLTGQVSDSGVRGPSKNKPR
jgi:excisionase family DNA binding protein